MRPLCRGAYGSRSASPPLAIGGRPRTFDPARDDYGVTTVRYVTSLFTRHSAWMVVALVLLTAVACGGNDDGPGHTASSTVPPADISGAVDAMVGDWGDDGALIVVMTAFDRGYTAAQVIDAAAGGRLQADGTVTDADPLRPPQDFLSDGPDETSPTTVEVAADRAGSDTGRDQGSAGVVMIGAGGLSGTDETTPEDRYVADADVSLSDVHDVGETEVARLNEEEADANFARWVSEMAVALGAQGYSGPQIIEAVYLGDLVPSPPGSHENCRFGISARGGGYLQPEFPPMAGLGCIAAGDEVSREDQADADPTGEGRSEDDGTTEDESAPETATGFPRTYRGEEGTHTLTGFAYDVPYTCEMDGPMELTLAADGTATFTYFNGVGVNATLSEDGTPQIDCESGSGNTWTGTYDPDLSTFEIQPPTPEGIETWDIGGEYDERIAKVRGSYSLPPNQAGQQSVVRIEAIDMVWFGP